MTDADGRHHPLGIPPHRVSWKQVAAVREAARTLLAPQFAEILEKTAQPFLQPIYDVLSPRLAFDRVALMGDAAFVARPHVGMGVTKAAEDAMALVAAVRQHGATPAALAAFEAARLEPGRAVVEHAAASAPTCRRRAAPPRRSSATRTRPCAIRRSASAAPSTNRSPPDAMTEARPEAPLSTGDRQT